MNNRNPIVSLTINPSLDINAEVDTLEPGKKLRCRHVITDPGGGGINVSRAVVRLGGTSSAIFLSGGSSGSRISTMIGEQGVEPIPVSMEGTVRQNIAIQEKKTGDQYRFGLPGPEIGEKEWQQCLEKTAEQGKTADYLVASGSLPPGVPEDFYANVAERFNDTPVKVVLDTSGKALKNALDQQIYMLKPNRRELEDICGCSLENEKKQEKMCRDLVAKGTCEVLVLTLGREGALLTSEKEQVRIPGISVDEVSSIGAGDSFVGGMVLALQQKKSLSDALLFGMAAGTAAMLSRGTQLCTREDTDTFFDKYQEIYRSL
jgi:6-phosphofructokinase 2